MDPLAQNYRRRALHQLAEILNLPNLTFQIIRRTIAIQPDDQTKGSVKATQGLLHHAHTPTTTHVYMQVIPEGVEKMVNSIHDRLRKPSKAVAEASKIRAKLLAKSRRCSVQNNARGLEPVYDLDARYGWRASKAIIWQSSAR